MTSVLLWVGFVQAEEGGHFLASARARRRCKLESVWMRRRGPSVSNNGQTSESVSEKTTRAEPGLGIHVPMMCRPRTHEVHSCQNGLSDT